uniref:Secreted protein n=1 Tax=Echeneis naucrates TaxID=173247 RepID=A0A665U328_ECHNA
MKKLKTHLFMVSLGKSLVSAHTALPFIHSSILYCLWSRKRLVMFAGRRCRCNVNQKPRAPGDEEAQEGNLIVSKGKMNILTF